MKETCLKCGTLLLNAPGIGPFCPNKQCDVGDNILGVKTMFEQEPQWVELKYTHGEDTVVHKYRMDGVDWPTAMQQFINFLRGIGYVIPDDEDRV